MSIAHGFQQQALERGFAASLKSLDEAVPLDTTQPAVICVSNFGTGEPPDNAKAFFRHVLSSDARAERLPFAVFGLGNKSYGGMYQQTGRSLDERLVQLGGLRLVPRGEGDSSNMHDPEDDFEAWAPAVFDALAALPPPADQRAASADAASAADVAPAAPAVAAVAVEAFSVVPLTHLSTRATVVNGAGAVLLELPRARPVHAASGGGSDLASPTRPMQARVVDHRELHHLASPHSCTHVAFDVSEPSPAFGDARALGGIVRFAYETGDYIGVLPENSGEDVERALSGLRHAAGVERQFSSAVLAASALVVAAPSATAVSAQHARYPATLDTMLRFYVDLSRPAPRRLLRLLTAHADTDAERASLESLIEQLRPRQDDKQPADAHAISTAGVLSRVSHSLLSRVSIAQLLAHVNPLAARFYSISSASSVHPHQAWLACGRSVHWDGARTTSFVGCASRALARLRPGDTALVFPVQSDFRLARLAADDQPIVMIANGSGMAPFRAFCEERRARRATGATVLLYGCIDREHFLYDADFAAWQAEGAVEVHAVFSHETPGQPQFVQHRLTHTDPVGRRIFDLVHKGGAPVFLCGTPAMGAGVTQALNGMARAHGLPDDDWVASLRAAKRFHREVFK